jgi:hypothetical protein
MADLILPLRLVRSGPNQDEGLNDRTKRGEL